MRTLLLSTAILGAAAGSAFAQDVEIFRSESDPLEIRTSELTGMRIYASEAALEADEYEGTQEGWEDIGEVGDVILSREGEVQAVLVDVGGFLGIGERQIAVNMDALRFVSDSATADELDDYFLVMNASRANLEEAPEYVMGETTAEDAATETEEVVGGAGAAAATAADAVTSEATEVGEEVGEATTAEAATDAATETEMEAEATAEAATGEVATDEMAATDDATTTVTTIEPEEVATTETTTGDAAATETTTEEATVAETTEGRTPITREGFITAETEALTADTLQGAAVYDANDERVGEVSELLMTEEGQVTDVVVDVGGFLGIGEKPVAMQLGNLDILQQEGGEEIRVYLSDTKEQLEALPAYEN